MIEVFTDGAALANSKDAYAGWACYFVDEQLLYSASLHSTNNYAELKAIQYAFYRLLKVLKPNSETIVIKSDSLYAINVSTGAYKAKANIDIIKSIQSQIKRLEANENRVRFEHVRAHTNGVDHDSVYNSIVDNEAHRRAEQLRDSEQA